MARIATHGGARVAHGARCVVTPLRGLRTLSWTLIASGAYATLSTPQARRPALLYRVLEYLQQEGLAERDDDGTVRVPDWRRLLEAWAEDAAFLSTNRTVKCIEPRGTEAFLGKLRETKSMRYAVTSSAAAAEWAPYAPARVIYVYVDSVEEASKEWNLRSSESSPNVILVEPRKPNDVAFDRVAESQRGFAIAAPAQVAVDLWNGPGRNPSEAQELLAWMSANESEWRK